MLTLIAPALKLVILSKMAFMTKTPRKLGWTGSSETFSLLST